MNHTMKKTIALVSAAVTLLLAGCSIVHHEHTATRWEYQKAYTIGAVNKAAADGWVVTGFSAYDANHTEIYLLKRPKQ